MAPREQLNRMFGRFHCKSCDRCWKSISTWWNVSQECRKCNRAVYPTDQTVHRPSDFRNSSGPHDQWRCDMCKRLGENCKDYCRPVYAPESPGTAPASRPEVTYTPRSTPKTKSCSVDVPETAYIPLKGDTEESSSCCACCSSRCFWISIILTTILLIAMAVLAGVYWDSVVAAWHGVFGGGAPPKVDPPQQQPWQHTYYG